MAGKRSSVLGEADRGSFVGYLLHRRRRPSNEKWLATRSLFEERQ